MVGRGSDNVPRTHVPIEEFTPAKRKGGREICKMQPPCRCAKECGGRSEETTNRFHNLEEGGIREDNEEGEAEGSDVNGIIADSGGGNMKDKIYAFGDGKARRIRDMRGGEIVTGSVNCFVNLESGSPRAIANEECDLEGFQRVSVLRDLGAPGSVSPPLGDALTCPSLRQPNRSQGAHARSQGAIEPFMRDSAM